MPRSVAPSRTGASRSPSHAASAARGKLASAWASRSTPHAFLLQLDLPADRQLCLRLSDSGNTLRVSVSVALCTHGKSLSPSVSTLSPTRWRALRTHLQRMDYAGSSSWHDAFASIKVAVGPCNCVQSYALHQQGERTVGMHADVYKFTDAQRSNRGSKEGPTHSAVSDTSASHSKVGHGHDAMTKLARSDLRAPCQDDGTHRGPSPSRSRRTVAATSILYSRIKQVHLMQSGEGSGAVSSCCLSSRPRNLTTEKDFCSPFAMRRRSRR